MAQGRTDSSTLFDRRTLVVLTCLIGAMTFASALLLALQPNPIAPAGNLSLAVVDSQTQGLDAIYQLASDPTQTGWRSIVIHHSGQSTGNAQMIGKLHQELGYGGLGWHFVIGNGQGATDGLIENGFRWTQQIDGVYIPGAISICLIGNGDRQMPTSAQIEQLTRLVRSLQTRLSIPSHRVYLHSDLADTTSPGRLFPVARLRAALVAQP